jgi:hypothetical protein
VLAGVITLEMALSSANVETPVSLSCRDALRQSTVGCALAVEGGGTGVIDCSMLASAGGGHQRDLRVRVLVGGGGRGHRSGRRLCLLDVGGIGSHHIRQHVLDRVATRDARHH